MKAKHISQAYQQLSQQSRLSDRDIWDLGQDSEEDIESLLEGLPMPQPSTASISDCFDAIPDAKSGLVTVTSSQRLIETCAQLPAALNQAEQKGIRLLDDVKSINVRLQAVEQKQAELSGKITEQKGNLQQLFDWMQKVKETENNKIKQVDTPERPSPATEAVGQAEGNKAYMLISCETAPTCFLLEFYSRPGNGYSGRIHHTLSNQVACFKGLNFEQILPFITKFLPRPTESNSVDQSIVGPAAPEGFIKPVEQITTIIEEQPMQAPECECSFIKEIGLLQDGQKTIRPPLRLQARKMFSVVLKLESAISQQDAIKSNYMLRYDVEIKVRHLLDDSVARQILQHGGMNSKFPTDTKAFNFDALNPGNYRLDVRVAVPQKNISEQMQREIYMV